MILDKDMFDNYTIKVNAETAGTLLKLVQELDYTSKTVGEVIALNKLWKQLEDIVDSERRINNVG